MLYNPLYLFLKEKLNGPLKKSVALDEGMMYGALPFESDGLVGGSDYSASSDDDVQSDLIINNEKFFCPVFYSDNSIRSGECIILLHGLNERSWNKYMPWGYELSRLTGKSVILFPIAYHINRSPQAWSNPRVMIPLVRERQNRLPQTEQLTIANVALSERLGAHPERFALSGMQAAGDLLKLVRTIRSGGYDLFKKGCGVQFFGYSIGAFLTQVLLLSNPGHLFDRTKTFIFCGGSAFQGMNGVSRYIMDSVSFQQVQSFYMKDWDYWQEESPVLNRVLHDTAVGAAFRKMLRFDTGLASSSFSAFGQRIQAMALKDDMVIPSANIEKTLGADNCLLEHFDYPYTHENPFPLYSKNSSKLMEKVNESFAGLMERAAAFFLVTC